MPTASRANAHRQDLNELVRLAENDLRLILQPHDDAETVRDVLMAALPRLVQVYGAAAATLAADWYDDLRADAAVRGRFTAVTAELPDTDRTDTLARWGAGPLFSSTPDKALVLARVAGGLQRIVADADRQTITTSSIEDRRALGWRRITSGACSYCERLASGGAVFGTSIDFHSHTNCECIAAPAFR